MSATVVSIDPASGEVRDHGAQIDPFGHTLLLGAFSDLCQLRDGETAQNRAIALDGLVKRLGSVLERYEP